MKFCKATMGSGLAFIITPVAIGAEIDVGVGRVVLTADDHEQIVDTPTNMIVQAIEVPSGEQIERRTLDVSDTFDGALEEAKVLAQHVLHNLMTQMPTRSGR